MTDPTIRPRLIDGEPVCSGEECPAYRTKIKGPYDGMELRMLCRIVNSKGQNKPAKPGAPCIPGLRRLLAEAREERDAARRELCEERNGEAPNGLLFEDRKQWYAASRGWSYLDAPTQGGGVKGGGE